MSTGVHGAENSGASLFPGSGRLLDRCSSGHSGLEPAAAWLFLISWNPVGEVLLGTLERRYESLAVLPAGTTHIVVLGGGAHVDDTRHAAVRLSRSSQGRVLEGVRLYRTNADGLEEEPPHLVFTGDSTDGRRSMASLAAETARDMGVPADRIAVLEQTYNTEQEARAVAELLLPSLEFGSSAVPPLPGRIVLVTSASHMTRATMVFRRAGLDPVPAPAQYLTDGSARTAWSLLPGAGALAKTETFVYEILGLLWMLMRGG